MSVMILVNFSNQLNSEWSEKQKEAAMSAYDVFVDMPFPNRVPIMITLQLSKLVDEYIEKIIDLNPTAVHIMGDDLTFICCLVHRLKDFGVRCIASTTRTVVVGTDRTKTVRYEFVKFRGYIS